ncbi:MAG: hypothetical protein WC365_10070 [Candidatus Babeliales bacterium]
MINCNIQATIVEVLSDVGNRVYKLKFDAPIGKSACAHLNLEGHEDQKAFYLCTEINNTVDVVVHNCSDLDSDVYYAWQPRLSVKPSACPRCKTRIDIVRTPLR